VRVVEGMAVARVAAMAAAAEKVRAAEARVAARVAAVRVVEGMAVARVAAMAAAAKRATARAARVAARVAAVRVVVEMAVVVRAVVAKAVVVEGGARALERGAGGGAAERR